MPTLHSLHTSFSQLFPVINFFIYRKILEIRFRLWEILYITQVDWPSLIIVSKSLSKNFNSKLSFISCYHLSLQNRKPKQKTECLLSDVSLKQLKQKLKTSITITKTAKAVSFFSRTNLFSLLACTVTKRYRPTRFARIWYYLQHLVD